MRSPNPTLLKIDEHKLLSQFFNYTPDLFCVASFEGRFLKVNSAVSETLGYSEDELLSMMITDLIVEEDKAFTGVTREQMLEGEPLINFENRYITKSGEIVWLSWTSVPVYKEKYILAIAKNVTRRREDERQQQLLYDDISRINKDLEHFARLASHNLRSPLSNIRSLFDLLNYDDIKSVDNLKVINLIRQSTEKVSVTLENYINELVKKDTNAKLRIEKLKIDESLAEVCESINAIIQNSKALIETDFKAFNDIEFNRSYLESILLNLLTNALKYRKVRFAPKVIFKTLVNEKGKHLIVSDNGLGFDIEYAKGRIFELNQTFHTNRDSKGVGLFLVKKQVIEMGASIVVDSEKNKGTVFTITFKP